LKYFLALLSFCFVFNRFYYYFSFRALEIQRSPTLAEDFKLSSLTDGFSPSGKRFLKSVYRKKLHQNLLDRARGSPVSGSKMSGKKSSKTKGKYLFHVFFLIFFVI
jgi:hypothetical protein